MASLCKKRKTSNVDCNVENVLLKTAIIPKINHIYSFYIMMLIYHIYQLMTILQENNKIIIDIFWLYFKDINHGDLTTNKRIIITAYT